jgi:hypothetical protein
MKLFNRLVVSYLAVWAFSYIIVAIFAPQISGDPLFGRLVYMCIGAVLLVSLWLFSDRPAGLNLKANRIGQVFLLVLSIVSVYGAVTSWTGLATWNVPFANKELFQVSMALANMIAAVLMFYLGSLNLDQT